MNTKPGPDARPTRRACQANCEQLFSTAGNLSDPHMDPKVLGVLVSIVKNKAAYNPCLAAIKETYFAKFRGKKMDTPPPATPASGAGPSGSGSSEAGPSGARSA